VSDQYIRYASAEFDDDEFVDRQMQIMPVRVRGAANAEAEAAILDENKAAISSFAARTQQQHDLTGGHRSFFQQQGDLRFTYTNSGNQPIVYVDVNAAPLALPTVPAPDVEAAVEPLAEEERTPVGADRIVEPDVLLATDVASDGRRIEVNTHQLDDPSFKIAVPPGGSSVTDDALIYDISPGELQLPAETYLGAFFVSANQSNLTEPGSVLLRDGQTFELPVDRSLAIVFSAPIDPVPDAIQEQIGYLRFPADIIWASDPAARPALYASATGYLNRSGFVPYPSPIPIYEIAVEVVLPHQIVVTSREPYDYSDLSNVEFLLGPNAVQGVDYDDRGFDFRGYVVTISITETTITYGTRFELDYFVLGESSTGRTFYDADASIYFGAIYTVGGKTLTDSYGYAARDPGYVSTETIFETSVGAEKIGDAGSTFTSARTPEAQAAAYAAAQQQITDILTLGPDFAVGWSLDVQERDSRTTVRESTFRPAEFVELYADATPFAQKPVSAFSDDEVYDRRVVLSDPFDPTASAIVGSRYIPDDAAIYYTDSIFYGENYDTTRSGPFVDLVSLMAVPLKVSVFSFASQADSDASAYPGSSDTPVQAISVDYPNGGIYENLLRYNPDKAVASE